MRSIRSISSTETWEDLDFVARFQLQASPAVMARGRAPFLSGVVMISFFGKYSAFAWYAPAVGADKEAKRADTRLTISFATESLKTSLCLH